MSKDVATLIEQRAKSAPISPISTALIDRSRFQARTRFDQEEIASLAKSVERHGLLNPVLVRVQEDRYELVAGERRLIAVRDVLKRNLIDTRIIECSDREAAEVGAEENLKRVDLLPSEKAHQALLLYQQDFTIEEISQIMGCSPRTVSNLLTITELPVQVQKSLDERQLRLGLVPVLGNLARPQDQKWAAEVAQKADLGPEQLLARVNHLPQKREFIKPQPKVQLPHTKSPKTSSHNDTTGSLQRLLLDLRTAVDEFELPSDSSQRATLKKFVDGTVVVLTRFSSTLG